MNARRNSLLLLAFLAVGCQSTDTRLLVAENSLAAAQNGWADLLERGVIKDRTRIRVGTAALNHANAAVARAYAARKQPTTMGVGGRPVDALSFWIDDVDRAVREAIATYEEIRAEETR